MFGKTSRHFVWGVLAIALLMSMSACYADSAPAQGPKMMEWRQYPVPSGTPLYARPSDAEFLKVLPPLRQEPKFNKRSYDLGAGVWWADYSTQLFSEQPPALTDLRRKPRVVTPAGEDEPIVLCLWGLKDAGPVRLEVAKSPFPLTIRHVEFDPRHVPGAYKVAGVYDEKVDGGRTVGFATYLPEQDTGQVKRGANTVFWVNVQVPAGTKPGNYRLSLKLTLQDAGKTIDLPVDAKVLGFSLGKADIAYGMMFRPNDRRVFPEARYRTPELMLAYWRDMVRHGMTSVSLYNYAGNVYDAEGNLKLDGNADIETLKDMMKEGLVRREVPIMFLGSIDPKVAGALTAELRRRNWPEFLYYGPDEPQVNDEMMATFKGLQPLRNSFRIITAMDDRAVAAYSDMLDSWMVLDGLITPEMRKLAAEKGAEVWTYDCFHRGRGNAPWSRFYAGIYTWALGLKGNFLWAYTEHYSWEGDRNAIFCYVLPSDNGPVPSIEWEARREGIEDYRTFRLLESLIASHPKSAVSKEASAWLQKLRGRVDWYMAKNMPPSLYPWDGPELYPMCPNFDQSELSAVRARAQELIRKLM